MKYILTILLILATTPVFGFGRRHHHNVCHKPVVYHYVKPTVVLQEKYVIPVREVKFSEVKGLRILSDVYGQTFYEINGKVVSTSTPQIVEEIKEKREKDTIIVERTLTQTY